MPKLRGVSGCSATANATPGCATLARLSGGDPVGSASVMSSWLLIEQPGPWPASAVESTLHDVIDDDRMRALRAAGMRPLLIRRPSRHARVEGGPVTVFVGHGEPGRRWLERVTLPDRSALAELDLEAVTRGLRGHGEPVDGPLFLVCTHGTKDVCCAVLGRPVALAMAKDHPHRTWEVSHVGGDRWAGNLLVVPDGYLHGQLGPTEAGLVAKSALARQVQPDNLRGRTTAATGWEQYAEVVVRRHTGLCGLDDVTARHVRHDGDPDSRTVTVTARGRRYEVVVRRHEDRASGHNRCTGSMSLTTFSTASLSDVTS